jgi:hypothetical protein
MARLLVNELAAQVSNALMRLGNLAGYPVFDIRGPGTMAFVMDRFPNSGNATEIAIDERKLLAMAYLPSNMPDIEAVMPFARELLDEWEEEFGQALNLQPKLEIKTRSRPRA